MYNCGGVFNWPDRLQSQQDVLNETQRRVRGAVGRVLIDRADPRHVSTRTVRFDARTCQLHQSDSCITELCSSVHFAALSPIVKPVHIKYDEQHGTSDLRRNTFGDRNIIAGTYYSVRVALGDHDERMDATIDIPRSLRVIEGNLTSPCCDLRSRS